MRSRLKVLRDSGYLLFARTFARLSTLPFLIYAAGKLGPAHYGILLFVTASVELLASLSNLGASRYGARAVVRHELPRSHLAGILLSLRLGIAIFLSACALVAIAIYTPPSPKLQVMLLGLAAMTLSSFIETTETLFTGAEKFSAAATLQVLGRLTYLAFGFLALGLGLSVVAVMAAYVIGIIVESILRMIYSVRNVTGFSLHFTRAELWTVVKGMLPFAVTAVASMIYYRVDALVIDGYHGDAAVGVYGVAYHFYSFYVWAPIVLSRALLPGLTAAYQRDPARAERSCWYWYRTVGVASLPVILVSTILAGPVIRNLMPPSYAESVFVLQVLLWSIPPLVMSSVGFVILTVADKEVLGAWLFVITAAVIFALDMLLIPRYSVNGAAAAMVAATVVLAAQVHWLLARYIFSPRHGLVRTYAMPVLGGIAMGAAAVLLWPLGWLPSMAGGLAAYGVVIFLVRMTEGGGPRTASAS